MAEAMTCCAFVGGIADGKKERVRDWMNSAMVVSLKRGPSPRAMYFSKYRRRPGTSVFELEREEPAEFVYITELVDEQPNPEEASFPVSVCDT